MATQKYLITSAVICIALASLYYLSDQNKPANNLKSITKDSVSKPTDKLYNAYFASFLPEMAKGFKAYNKGDAKVAKMSDFQILKILFPGVKKEGDYPDLETAKQRFTALAKAGRPYAQGFNPNIS
jgi:hypothetical protein